MANLLHEDKRINGEDVWLTEDTKRAIMLSIVPGALSFGAFAFFRNDKNLIIWYNRTYKPKWAKVNPFVYGILNAATIIPSTYAACVVYKHGGGLGHNETKLALSLFASTLTLAIVTIPIMKKTDYDRLFSNTILVHLSGIGTAIAFGRIHDQAGILMVPYVLWTGFCSFLTYSLKKMNRKSEIDLDT
ncbi:unnamed protein product [Thelazia callipaeda]|uniref:DUF1751-domain-containing protein n=1 Tax=Thelazia callipaeda TaxID=103827 RepID=A0A0N5D504_THECL|nr:unnamed protein product [Thelazia callipaeda]